MIDRALERPLKFCRQAGCPNKTRNDDGYCDVHQKDNETAHRERVRRLDGINRMYHREPWLSFRRRFLSQNWRCQRLHDGEQCENASTLVHHLQSPRGYPQGFLDPHNVVGLCAACHPPDEGTPTWTVGIDFVASVYEPVYIGGTYNEHSISTK